MKLPLAQAVAPSTGSRLAGIEGLRGVAVASIVLYHVWRIGSPGGATVAAGRWTSFIPNLAMSLALFYTLSGFLLYRPFIGALLGSQPRPSFRAYLRNRALRIAPAYWVIFVFAAFVLETITTRLPSGVTVDRTVRAPGRIFLYMLLGVGRRQVLHSFPGHWKPTAGSEG
jgi:peptidoglycan/LPS O-acetylase OafA/YrhL